MQRPYPGPQWLSSQESTCQCRKPGFNHRVRKIPWSRKWQPTPVFLPGESRVHRRLVGNSPWGGKESDMTKNTHKGLLATNSFSVFCWECLLSL